MTEAAPDCLFCRMVAGDITPDVVAETPTTLAFRDLDPQAPTHVLVVPKAHHATIGALAAADPGLAAELLAAAQAVAVAEGLATDGAPEPGWRLVANSGPDAGQTVHHVHLHVLGGRGLGWPPG